MDKVIKKWYIVLGIVSLVIAGGSYFLPTIMVQYYSRPQKIQPDGGLRLRLESIFSTPVIIKEYINYNQPQHYGLYSQMSSVKLESVSWSITTIDTQPHSQIDITFKYIKEYAHDWKNGVHFNVQIFPRDKNKKIEENFVNQTDLISSQKPVYSLQTVSKVFQHVYPPKAPFELGMTDFKAVSTNKKPKGFINRLFN